MQGDAGKYGLITTQHGEPPIQGEPFFLLRGKDWTAPQTIRRHAALAEQQGASAEYVQATRERADEIAAWQVAHHELVKVPDN